MSESDLESGSETDSGELQYNLSKMAAEFEKSLAKV